LEGNLRQTPSRTKADFVAGFGEAEAVVVVVVVVVVVGSCSSGSASKE